MAKKTNDALVSQLLQKVAEKKAQIDKIKNPEFKTNLSFPMDIFGTSNRINLNVASPEILFSLLVYINTILDNAKGTAVEYGIGFDYKWFGFQLDDWRDDIVLKIKQNQCHKQVKELREIEAKLKSLMSEEHKTNLELENIKSLLGD